MHARDFGKRYRDGKAEDGIKLVHLTAANSDAPANVKLDQTQLKQWQDTAHAAANINCTDCHNVKDKVTGKVVWQDKPGYESCKTCHDDQVHGFLSSRHGMRLAQGMSPMTPGMARLPMLASAADKQMTCNTCHAAHSFDTTFAATNACMQCHADKHTLAFKGTAHEQTWLDEQANIAPKGSGVSCATCHLPRVQQKIEGQLQVTVMHNQNDYLRPNEKMIRPVCLQCHGLSFAIDALADRTLIDNNFNDKPSKAHFTPSSFDLIKQKMELENKEKNKH
jgi:hypothetical protein